MSEYIKDIVTNINSIDIDKHNQIMQEGPEGNGIDSFSEKVKDRDGNSINNKVKKVSEASGSNDGIRQSKISSSQKKKQSVKKELIDNTHEVGEEEPEVIPQIEVIM